ncbi:AtpZ/AtpI family protein [Sphingomonas sp. CJ99]
MTEQRPGLDPLGQDAQLESLEARLKRAQVEEAVRRGEAQPDTGKADTRMGNRVLAELIGGMVGGAVVGYVLDLWFETSPWLLLAMLALGVAGAFRNIIRIANRRSK